LLLCSSDRRSDAPQHHEVWTFSCCSHPCSKTSCYYSFILKTSSKGEEINSVEPGSRFKGRWLDDETRGRMMTCAQRAQRMTPVVRVENDEKAACVMARRRIRRSTRSVLVRCRLRIHYYKMLYIYYTDCFSLL